MEMQYVIALVIAIPIILFPAAFVWFLNVSRAAAAWKESRARAAKRAKAHKEVSAQ